MSKAEEWYKKQLENEKNSPTWRSKGAFLANARLFYRGPGSAALLKLESELGLILLAPIDARSLGEWLLEMFGD
ncbi:MAG: hypothetical protein E6Q97_30880 [Desulfurellales bacterium]|nr:MAG: hypothetical protein E6Q97_30880 [Desulfurellales bacterium]